MPEGLLRRSLAVVTLALAFAFGGCSLLEPEHLDAPAVSLRGLELEAMGINSQVFRARLGLFNPNSVPLKVSHGEFVLQLEGVEAAQGHTLEPFTVPAAAEQEVEVLVTTNLLADAPALFRALTGEGTGEGVGYELTGHVDVERRGRDRVPIRSTGRLNFPFGPAAGQNDGARTPGTSL